MNADTEVKYNVVMPHNMKVVPVSLEENIKFVKLLLKGSYTFKINTQSNATLTFLHATKWLYHQRDLN